MKQNKVAIIIPTLNGERELPRLLLAISRQSKRADRRLILDSQSDDETVNVATTHGFDVRIIERHSFSHGGTRQLGVELLSEADIIIFMTQDAILADEMAFERIVACFDDATVGMAYGRQLPKANASPLAAHARLFNYPPDGRTKELRDSAQLGIKTVFVSNSFAAYRREALKAVGGFPPSVILGEDMYVAAKMILAGWKIGYSAEAQVYHSHDYSILEELRRYFDTGVFHVQEPWILDAFGKSEGEGLRFVLSEWKYLWDKRQLHYFPKSIVHIVAKYIGYQLGKQEKILPLILKRKLSMHWRWWGK